MPNSDELHGMHILLHINARRVTHPWGRGIFMFGILSAPHSVLYISSFGWFWFVPFCYNKTAVIRIMLSSILWVLANYWFWGILWRPPNLYQAGLKRGWPLRTLNLWLGWCQKPDRLGSFDLRTVPLTPNLVNSGHSTALLLLYSLKTKSIRLLVLYSHTLSPYR